MKVSVLNQKKNEILSQVEDFRNFLNYNDKLWEKEFKIVTKHCIIPINNEDNNIVKYEQDDFSKTKHTKSTKFDSNYIDL